MTNTELQNHLQVQNTLLANCHPPVLVVNTLEASALFFLKFTAVWTDHSVVFLPTGKEQHNSTLPVTDGQKAKGVPAVNGEE